MPPRRLVLLLCILLPLALTGCRVVTELRETPAEHQAAAYAEQEIIHVPRHDNLPDYTLPPEALIKARQLSHIGVLFFSLGTLWSVLQILLLLELRIIARLRDLATAHTQSRWLQAYLFLALFLLARALLNLPLNVYGHHLGLAYHLSIERWPAWFADLAKSLALEWLIGGALLLLLVTIIRRAPQRWWLIFWTALVPIVLLGAYLTPIVRDPLFNHFEPLAPSHPALSAQLEHMGVPRDRQFLMRASAKVTTPNAYVTGLGPSKRVVVWDTSLSNSGRPGSADTPTPEVLWMVGHECGHYALNHVREGILLTLLGLLPLLWLGARLTQATLSRFGPRWRIPAGVQGQHDLSALPVLLLAFTLLTTLAAPISNAVSRSIEHNADIYGQEAIHTLVPDPQTAVLRANDQDGLRALEDPNPTRPEIFWLYNHPATGRRAAFGKAYNPWLPGLQPKFFTK
jgi:Zn-dependent protease with chaperone function